VPVRAVVAGAPVRARCSRYLRPLGRGRLAAWAGGQLAPSPIHDTNSGCRWLRAGLRGHVGGCCDIATCGRLAAAAWPPGPAASFAAGHARGCAGMLAGAIMAVYREPIACLGRHFGRLCRACEKAVGLGGLSRGDKVPPCLSFTIFNSS